MTTRTRIAILGGSGYTGAELIRLLLGHPQVEIAALSGDSQAGKPVEEVYPHLVGYGLPALVRAEEISWDKIEVAFCCLPHGMTQEVVAALPEHLIVIDLSADFRLADAGVYAQWYGHAHRAIALQQEAVYGLTEHARAAVAKARIIANPGCYPTGAQLPLIPLLRAGLIERDGIVINSVSGTTGAGRAAKQSMLFSEMGEGMSPYGVGHHRHMPEIEQGLTQAAGGPVGFSFTPHLAPMSRGILSTIYVAIAKGARVEDLRQCLAKAYAREVFVPVVAEGVVPATQHVRGSNRCMIGVFADRVPGRAILVSALDNLVKGASGQAVQNLNVRMGWDEALGLGGGAIFP